MATCEDSPLMFAETCNDTFYFLDTEYVSRSASPKTDLCPDAFRKGKQRPNSYWIQSMDQKFLVLRTSGNFEFEDRTTHDRGLSDCKFDIQIYQDSTEHTQPVMLYACINGQKMMVSCKNNKEVSPEPMNTSGLDIINETRHKALFRWKNISTGKYKFESTMYTGYFLAFEPLEDKPCLHKLILRPEPKDEVDESMVISVSNCKLK
ncbi:hypothetical protein CRENBAI_024530 [Crenichthys baileyi]|uniref:Interleukin-18 n=1 Tax=Crenichthys baileyi TaxID=28760 RepID=A0AAV9RPE2_9TELE